MIYRKLFNIISMLKKNSIQNYSPATIFLNFTQIDFKKSIYYKQFYDHNFSL